MRPLRERLVEVLAGDAITRRVGEVEARLRTEADARVREALSAGLTRADELLMQQGFRRLTSQGVSTRDLTPLAQDRMLALAYWLWESNPLAQWLVEVVVDFVWGEGGTITAEDPAVQQVLTAFWEDPINQLERRMDDFIRELGLQGELCLPVGVNFVTGQVRLGYVDPAEIDEVTTDPDNALVPITVVLKGTGGGRKRYLKVVREDTAGVSPYVGLMMPALVGERDPVSGQSYEGACLLQQINRLSGARRGRSDLLSLIDWLDGYDALLFDQMDRAQQLDSFVWHVTLDGYTEEQIETWLQKNKRIRRGMVRASNEKVHWDAVAPDLKANDRDTLLRLLRGHMLGARSLPEHYYGLGGDVNLATAKEMGLPTVKRMTRRQKVVRFMLRDWARFAIDQAIVAGTLPKTVDKTVQVTLPEISVRDTSAFAQALSTLSVALTQAEDQGWLRRETAAKLFALVASQLGQAIDAAEEVAGAGQPRPAETRDYDPDKVRSLVDRLEGR